MSEMVMNTVNFLDLIKTERIKVRVDNNIYTVIPILDLPESPLRGLFRDGLQSTEDFMRRKREEKELDL